jgi:hypothetical protein
VVHRVVDANTRGVGDRRQVQEASHEYSQIGVSRKSVGEAQRHVVTL